MPKCQLCGIERESYGLHTHHRDKDRTNNQENNLVILCPKCHSQVHHGKLKIPDTLTEKVAITDAEREMARSILDRITYIKAEIKSIREENQEGLKRLSLIGEEIGRLPRK